MTDDKPFRGSAESSEIQRLVRRAAKQAIMVDQTSAKALLSLGALAATRKLDGVCRLIRASRTENLRLGFTEALRRVDMCGGNVEEAIRRTLTGGAEVHEAVADMVEYAADRGVTLAPLSIHRHVKQRGRDGTQAYIDKLAAVMDAAAILEMDCSQARAAQCLSRAQGDAQRVIADFAAEACRRADRREGKCRVIVPPRIHRARPNAFAGCGCPHCRDRLAAHMENYIAKMLAAPLFRDLDRDEMRAEANLELIQSIETWPGGNFTGWFATRFANRVRSIHRARSNDEREMLSLDAEGVLSNDEGGRMIPLGERVPDRSVDVLMIVILRERLAEAALALRQLRADRGDESDGRRAA
jgi:hypothetical protein